MLVALDAPLEHPESCTAVDVWPSRDVPAPTGQRPAMPGRTRMRRARAKTHRPLFLAALERRDLDGSELFVGSLKSNGHYDNPMDLETS